MGRWKHWPSGQGSLALAIALVCVGLAACSQPTVTPHHKTSNQIRFEPPVAYNVGQAPFQLAVADLDHDGNPDLITANSYIVTPSSTASVSVLLGRGDGTFPRQKDYATTRLPKALVVADLDGDGNLDLATANDSAQTNGTVSVLLGNGDGTFRPYVNYGTGLRPQSIAAADFNGDGNLDLVTADSGAGTVSVLLGNGDGTFGLPRTTPVGTKPWAVAAADLNGDGRPDIAVVNDLSPSPCQVSILLGRGDGTFQYSFSYGLGRGPSWELALGDVNADGNLDMVAANSQDDTVTIFLGRGDGKFQTIGVTAGTGSFPLGVALADIDGNGATDVLAAAQGADAVSVLRGNGDGTFRPYVPVATDLLPSTVVAADFNHDGKMDLATGSTDMSTVSVVLQR